MRPRNPVVHCLTNEGGLLLVGNRSQRRIIVLNIKDNPARMRVSLKKETEFESHNGYALGLFHIIIYIK